MPIWPQEGISVVCWLPGNHNPFSSVLCFLWLQPWPCVTQSATPWPLLLLPSSTAARPSFRPLGCARGFWQLLCDQLNHPPYCPPYCRVYFCAFLHHRADLYAAIDSHFHFNFFFKKHSFIYCVWVCTPRHACGGQRTISWS